MKSLTALALLLIICAASQADTRFLVTQSTPTDCGPAALATLFNFYLDIPTSEAEMMRLCEYRAEAGTTLLGLKRGAESKKCQADSRRMTYAVLKKQLHSFPVPVVVRLLNPEPHFVVLLALDDNSVYLADPALGNVVLNKESFWQQWYAPGSIKGYVFLILSTPLQRVNTQHIRETVKGLQAGQRHLRHFRPWRGGF